MNAKEQIKKIIENTTFGKKCPINNHSCIPENCAWGKKIMSYLVVNDTVVFLGIENFLPDENGKLDNIYDCAIHMIEKR
jgi:hypothetical protein